jgi:hypothetical protein
MIAAMLLGTLLAASMAWAGEDFAIGGAQVQNGTRASGTLAVPAKDGAGTEIPYTVIHGTKKGPGGWKEDVRAPFTGILLYVLGTPPCNAGEPLFEVGRVKEK